MTREQATRRFQKLVGKRQIRLDVGDGISSPERRAEAGAEWERVSAEIKAGDERVAAIIAAHPEIQAIKARRRELAPLRERLNWARFYKKFRLLNLEHGIAWWERGAGDTWEQAIAAAEASVAKATDEARS